MHNRNSRIPFVLALVAALGLSACSGPVRVAGPDPSSPVVQETKAAAEETPTPQPVAEQGSRSAPYAAGTSAKYAAESMWTFTLGSTDADSYPEFLAANQYVPAPEDGTTFVTAHLHVLAEHTEQSDATGADPWASFRAEYVTASGNTYDETKCWNENSINSLGTMYGGAEADVIVCSQVPVADIPGGVWKLTSVVTGVDSAFWAGA